MTRFTLAWNAAACWRAEGSSTVDSDTTDEIALGVTTSAAKSTVRQMTNVTVNLTAERVKAAIATTTTAAASIALRLSVIANVASISVRKILPARAALLFPIARRLAVDEYVNAAAGPRFPRSHASNGIASNNRSSHGRANVNALSGHQSNSRKLTSLHKTNRFVE